MANIFDELPPVTCCRPLYSSLEIILATLLTLSFFIFLDSIITLLLNLKSEKRDKYIKMVLIFLSVSLLLIIFSLFFTEIFYFENSHLYLSDLLIRSINWEIGIISIYGIILIIYSPYLFITKKPNAAKILLKGILWLVIIVCIVALGPINYGPIVN